MNTDRTQYFQKQIRLAEIGLDGQEKLAMASVLVVGCGGLGCAVLQSLAGAGIGVIGLMDFDVVELSNLHRQGLYSTNDLGRPKVLQAASALQKQYPHTRFVSHQSMLIAELALQLFPDYDLVVDATDRLSVRYLISDVCALLGKTWIYGAVNGFSLQYAVLNQEFQYRSLFPLPPSPEMLNTCDTSGTIGVVPFAAGSMQAMECIRCLLGFSQPGLLHTWDGQTGEWYYIKVAGGKNAGPDSAASILAFDYPRFCEEVPEVSVSLFAEWLAQKKVLVIDVREEDELPVCKIAGTRNVPLRLAELIELNPKDTEKIVVLCQTGIRSRKAVSIIGKKYPHCGCYSLAGGMEALAASGLNQ